MKSATVMMLNTVWYALYTSMNPFGSNASRRAMIFGPK